nr:MAG TPA: hypothetical protein [Caudoviricetes sp.]
MFCLSQKPLNTNNNHLPSYREYNTRKEENHRRFSLSS